MVTAVTSMGRSGLYDWLMQRISAVVLLAYFVFVGLVLLGGVDYASWKGLYSQTWMRTIIEDANYFDLFHNFCE